MGDRSFLLERRFLEMRNKTSLICENLETEDFVVQPEAFVSPPKWHLGHTTWFLEEILLNKFEKDYVFYNPQIKKVFNSYYNCLGEHWAQEKRGILSRPTVSEVLTYRKKIEQQILELIYTNRTSTQFLDLLEIAINHEEQHQELLLMDIKVILAANPTSIAYSNTKPSSAPAPKDSWRFFPEGVYEIGTNSTDAFHFDNESPKHKVYLQPFGISEKLVTNGEYLNFINSGGYEHPGLWLSKGLDWVQKNNSQAPLYWRKTKTGWNEFTLYGLQELDLHAPVCHINYFEADAYARWAGMRLPTEAEFEVSCQQEHTKKKPVEFHPSRAETFSSELWCWTQSHYSPYPGYKPFKHELSEYNGKFMCNQFVLRGGCVATPTNHYRKTYRNFYEPDQRWMFSGISLAKDIL